MTPRWSEITAIFGGRMDPPHLGHREAVRGLFKNPGVKQVVVIPSASPPHKPAIAKAKDRAEITKLTFANTVTHPFPSEVRIDLLEIEKSLKAPNEPSYSFYTIQELQRQYPQLAFALGADQFAELNTWHRFPEILSLCHWIVLERKPDGKELIERTLSEWRMGGILKNMSTTITVVPTNAPNLSSTTIRQVLTRTGVPPSGALLPEVESYLSIAGIYGTRVTK